MSAARIRHLVFVACVVTGVVLGALAIVDEARYLHFVVSWVAR